MTFLIVLSLIAAPADTLSLSQAYRYAIEAYPLRQQIGLQETISELRARNLEVRRLPALSLRGQAVYYSDVAEISLPAVSGSLPRPAKDQYKLALGIDQLVYDGGVTSQLRQLESVQRDLEEGKVEVELYRLKEQVNVAFFGALVFEAQANVLDLLRSDLNAKQGVVRSLVENGVSLQSNADVLAAEQLSAEQQYVEARSNGEWARAVLSELIDRTIEPDDVLLAPALDDAERLTPERDRPEFRVFDLGRTALKGEVELIRRRNRPSLSVFAESAFGRPPGLDLFETDFQLFYSAGVRMNWNPWKWRSSRRSRTILSLQQGLLDSEERSFSKQMAITLQRHISDIARLRQQIKSDDEAVTLRARITRQAASQLENGVITSTDYLTERNAESRAQLALEIHRIQLAQARAQYLTTIGK